MDKIDPRRSALVLVDYQARLMPAIHEGARAMANAVKLADVARELSIPVVGTEENPQGLGPNAEEVRSRCAHTVAKTPFDACPDGLLEWLDSLSLGRGPGRGSPGADIVIGGCEAHVCLMQTALGLLRAGYRTWVVVDACGSRFPADKELAMQRLQGAGATLVSAEMVAFEWLESCRHERFKAVLQRLK
jgi:nicotinamidase-related amidase